MRPTLAAVTFLFALCSLTAYSQTPITVEVVQLKYRPLIEEVPLSGTVYSPQIARVSAQVNGLIKALHVDAGDRAEAGTLLLELDTEMTRIAKDAAAAERQRAIAQRDDAQRRWNDAKALAQNKNIAASEVEALAAQVGIRNAELAVAEAQLQRVQAELDRHQIRAPFAGTVSERFTAAGEWVSPGTALLELVDSDHLTMDFQVPQRYYPAIQNNAELALQFDAYPGETYIARVSHKVPLSRAGARTFLIRGQLQGEQKPALIAGMSVSGVLRVDAQRSAIAVPRDALIRYPDGRVSVWVVTDPAWGQPSPVREQRVATGLSTEGWVEITEGLQENTVVVTTGNEALREGQTVTVREAQRY